MPYKSPEAQKEANRIANQRYRNKQKGITPEGITGQGITPAILIALLDPEKREKLERISYQLNKRKLGSEVRYGVAGPTFDVVGQMLELTE